MLDCPKTDIHTWVFFFLCIYDQYGIIMADTNYWKTRKLKNNTCDLYLFAVRTKKCFNN